MNNIDKIWQNILKNIDLVSEQELQLLLDDRLWFVTDNLKTITATLEKEKIFDLIMLGIDSLQERRAEILHLKNNKNFDYDFICKLQSQLMREINIWHQHLNLAWGKGTYFQNYAFLGMLTYAANIWIDDHSPDSAKVMAKTDEMIDWLLQLKSNPMGIFKIWN